LEGILGGHLQRSDVKARSPEAETSKPASKKSSFSATSLSSSTSNPESPAAASSSSIGAQSLSDPEPLFPGGQLRALPFFPPNQLIGPKPAVNNFPPLYNPFFYHNFFRFPPNSFQM
jgi:hypothetical protein